MFKQHQARMKYGSGPMIWLESMFAAVLEAAGHQAGRAIGLS
jgi:hypothetical protein